jgi:DNA-binding SARP family transcriptional activator
MEGTVGGKVEPLRIRLLGGFLVSVGDRAVEESTWRLRKAASIVKLLALAPNHRLHREQVMESLWPNLGRRAASNNLRQALHVARHTLAPTDRYLGLIGEQIVLCPDAPLWVDVDAFEVAAKTVRRSREPGAYEAALELYAGELLPEDRYEEWAEERRQQVRELYLSLLVELAAQYEQRSEFRSAIEALSRAVAEEPTSEEVHVGLMRLYALSGRKAEALRQYELLGKIVSQDLEGEPSATSRVEEVKVLDFLSGLIEKSLVVAELTAGGGIRYRMLEPLRQYALEKLAESAEIQEVQNRHAEFFLALAEEAEPQMRGPEQAAWFGRLETEHDNLRVALSWALEHEEAELGLRLSGTLWWFWMWQGHRNEGRRWLQEALATNREVAPSVRAKALNALADLVALQGDYDPALLSYKESLALSGVVR